MTVSTTSRPRGLVGSQVPRVLHRPKFASEAHAEEAIELGRSVGVTLDPWQELSVRVTLAETASGLYAAGEVAQLVARQNGKGGWLEVVVLDGLFLVCDPLTLWTAHQFKTSQEAFLRIKDLIDGSDNLRKRIKKVSSSHGEEGFEVLPQYGGGRLRFLARSKSSGRGFSPQRVVWDEAQELSLMAIRAMHYAMRAQRNKQSIYTGTVPDDEVNHPEHFTGLRDRGRAGKGKRLAWMEWSPKDSDDPAVAERIVTRELGERRHWKAATPGLGYRITEDSIRDDFEAMGSTDPWGFAREALSIWPTLPDADEEGALDTERWAGQHDPKARKPRGDVVVVVDVAPDRSRSSVGVAGAGRGGRVLLLSRSDDGTSWVADHLEKLLEKRSVTEVCVHPQSQAGALLPEITAVCEAAGVDLHLLNGTELGQSCSSFITGVNVEDRFAHVDQPELNDAVGNAKTVTRGEVELWERKDWRIDITPLVAVAAAAYRYAQLEDYDPDDSVG